MLQENPRVCIEIDQGGEVISAPSACRWGMRYRSLIVFGQAEILEDAEEKRKGLACIMEHYGAPRDVLPARALDRVALIRIQIDEISGKECGW